MIRVLDLFSGIGGFSLGLERAGFSTVAFCEIEKYPRLVLSEHWPNVPIYEDVRLLDGKQFRGSVELVCGGFPCQPFSVAGQQQGKSDDRHLWPEMLRVIKEVRPTWVIGENVAGLIAMALDDVLSDLEGEGYTCQAFVIPACAVGAVHRRDRVWIIAHTEHGGSSASEVEGCISSTTDNDRKGEKQAFESQEHCKSKCNGCLQASKKRNASHTDSSGCREGDKKMEGKISKQFDGSCVQSGETDTDTRSSGLQRSTEKQIPGFSHIQGKLIRGSEAIGIMLDASEPAISGVCNGFPGRVDRIKALGNAVVPQIVELIGRAIISSTRRD